ncbi:MAG: efflux RND transporter periplasmic adaptor subunit [Acidobacteriota bacterium]
MKNRTFMLPAALLVLAVACSRSTNQSESGEPVPEAEAAAEEQAIPESVHLTPAAISEAGIGTWTVKPVDIEHLLSLNGSVEHDENKLLQVSANVRGRAVAMPVDLGARVKKGDVLVTIESVELGRTREEFIRELSELRVASRAYERARALVEAKAISAGEFQAREGAYLSKKAAVDAVERTLHLLGESQQQVDRLRADAESGTHSVAGAATLDLRAPFGGRVIDRKIAPGALFEALQPLLTLADLTTVWVFMQAYEKDLAQLHEGVNVTIRTEAYPEQPFEGKIDFLSSVVDSATRTVRMRATVANADEMLRPGMFVKAQVSVPASHAGKTVVAIPQSALQTLEGRSVVFVEAEPGVFVRRFVETGHNFESLTEIFSGVKTGEVVVTEGSFVLKSEFAKASLAEED